jgi:DNA polymerase elongation subunit (family B)
MLIGLEHNSKNHIVASYYNDAGAISYIDKELGENDLFRWEHAPKGTSSPFKAWNNRPLIKRPARYLSRTRMEELIKFRFTEADKKLLFSEYRTEPVFLDIETFVNEEGDFPDPELAEFPILLISLVKNNTVLLLHTLHDFDGEEMHKLTSKVNSYMIEHKRTEVFNIKSKYFETEVEMLEFFCHNVLPTLTLVTGWNVIDFDWQTLMNRCVKNGVNITKRLKSTKLAGKYRIPVHLGLLDYMEMAMEFRPIKMPENFTLDYFGKTVLGMTKVHHGYSSFNEFQKDHFAYAYYNIIDSIIVKLIDKEKQLLNVAYALADVSMVELQRIFSPVTKTEIFMCREFLEHGKFMPDIRLVGGDAKKYKGAYVMQPTPGHYVYVALFDFASQYPNVTMQFNISPDAYLGKVGVADLSQYDKKDLIFTKNNTVFLGNFDSVARIILNRYYSKRDEIKGEGGTLQLLKAERVDLIKIRDNVLALEKK